MTLQEFMSLVQTERLEQISQHGFTPAHDAMLIPAQWTAILARHVGLSADDGGQYDPARFRRQMIRVAATALAALEARAICQPTAPRQTAPLRTLHNTHLWDRHSGRCTLCGIYASQESAVLVCPVGRQVPITPEGFEGRTSNGSDSQA